MRRRLADATDAAPKAVPLARVRRSIGVATDVDTRIIVGAL
ncbi:hypothetical protein [Halobellus salinisoli]